MKFWDPSAIVPLLVEEPTSATCRQLARADPAMVVWCLARLEVRSAIERLRREAGLPDEALAAAERRLDRLGARWTEVDALFQVRDRAERLLRLHPVRAADALQLAAALIAVGEQPRGRQFVTLDDDLFAAADREGFDAVWPAES